MAILANAFTFFSERDRSRILPRRYLWRTRALRQQRHWRQWRTRLFTQWWRMRSGVDDKMWLKLLSCCCLHSYLLWSDVNHKMKYWLLLPNIDFFFLGWEGRHFHWEWLRWWSKTHRWGKRNFRFWRTSSTKQDTIDKGIFIVLIWLLNSRLETG